MVQIYHKTDKCNCCANLSIINDLWTPLMACWDFNFLPDKLQTCILPLLNSFSLTFSSCHPTLKARNQSLLFPFHLCFSDTHTWKVDHIKWCEGDPHLLHEDSLLVSHKAQYFCSSSFWWCHILTWVFIALLCVWPSTHSQLPSHRHYCFKDSNLFFRIYQINFIRIKLQCCSSPVINIKTCTVLFCVTICLITVENYTSSHIYEDIPIY